MSANVRDARAKFRKSLARAWKAAKHDRLLADWLSAGDDLNQEMRHSLPVLRTRARELEQNSNAARRFLQLVETHIVGPQGFGLQIKGKLRNGKPDDKRNRQIHDAWWDWMRPGVGEVTGRMSGPAWQRLFARTVARDGEGLLRMHDHAPTAENPYGFSVELLNPERLEHQYFDQRPNGNHVILGVEIDRRGRPVAYYLRRDKVVAYPTGENLERVPAGDLIHFFVADRPEQVRGVTWMASAMLTMHMLDAYQDAAVTAARWGASKMGFFTNPEGSPVAGANAKEDGEFITEVEPGVLEVLPEGWDFSQFDPKYPHEAYNDFVKVMNRDGAMGLGVSYHGLTGDLSEANYGSMRGGALEEREGWMVKQDTMADTVMARVYVRWLNAAALHGALGLAMPQDEIVGRYSAHLWQGRRWPWVDPKKDIETAILAIGAKLRSPQMVAAELGVDIEDVLDQLVDFNDMLKAKGLDTAMPDVKGASKEVSDAIEED